MPWGIFVAKYGIAMSFLTSYFASFIDTRIFPIEKRATAIGVCNLIARSLAGICPMINELKEPTPMVFFVTILIVAFVNTATLNLEE